MVDPRRWRMALLVILLLSGGSATLHAHQDPCHRLHSCPSDGHPYVCGDRGRCEQCPDNQYCLAGKPRVTALAAPAPVPPAPTAMQPSSSCGITVCFTPGGNCTNLIGQTLGEATSSLLVQAYGFTSAPIAKARAGAHTRGVRVEVILDQRHRTDQYAAADVLANQGVSTTIDATHAISQHKVMVINDETVITGSFKCATSSAV
jgi:phosphatidylserine/phosphatidylglycerophosphate/cardiolipin synthase-like enzyme